MSQNPVQIRRRAHERARRIKDELKDFGSLRKLHQAIRERLGSETRGTSYGAIRAIVEGEVDHPRPNVLAAIADSLGVRFGYLMDLDMPRTEAESVRYDPHARGGTDDDAPSALEGGNESWHALYEAIDAGRADLPAWIQGSFHGASSVFDGLVIEFLESGGEALHKWSLREVEEAAQLLGWLIAAPGHLLAPPDTGWISPNFGRNDTYFMAMAMALRSSISRAGRGRPRDALAVLRQLREKLVSETTTHADNPLTVLDEEKSNGQEAQISDLLEERSGLRRLS